MEEVQAGAKAWITAEFYDKDNDPVIPTSASYKVTCTTTSTQIRDTTALTPAASIEIELSGTDTAIQDASNDVEVRKICVTSNFGAGDSRLDNYRIKVRATSPCL